MSGSTNGMVQDIASHVAEGVWLHILWDPTSMQHHLLLEDGRQLKLSLFTIFPYWSGTSDRSYTHSP